MKTLTGGIIVAALVFCLQSASAQPSQKVTLLLNFYLYSEHAPFFLGVERGYFAKENIDLDIQEGRGSVSTVQAVANGTAQFGYADFASVVKAAVKDAPVLTVGILLQTSPMAIIALKESKIATPADLRGKTVALTPGDSLSQIWPLFLKKTNLSESDVKIVAGDARTKVNAVINNQADAMLGYLMDQNLKIEDATHKPVVTIPFSTYGINLMSSCIVVSKATAQDNADLVRRFMRAATRAVEDSEKDPAAAVDAMLKMRPKAGDRVALVKGLELTVPLYHTEATKGGLPFKVDPAAVKQTLELLTEYGGVDKTALDHADSFYTFADLPN
jgi:NitT/TauT family transport system substrate-binding protein